MSKIPSTNNSKKVKYDPMKSGAYVGRMTMFVGLGVQPQPEFQGKAKGPAFKAQLGFELIGKKVSGVDGDGKAIDPRPSCVFQDVYLFPGSERGKAFDVCKALDPTITKVPDTLDWFINKLGSPLIVTVGQYENKYKEIKNKVIKVGEVLEGMAVGDPESDLIGFDPYSGDAKSKETYDKLWNFQQDLLSNALDAKSIPFAQAKEEPATQSEPTVDSEDGRSF